MNYELTKSETDDIIIGVVRKINTNASYNEALNLSAEKAKEYFAKWADQNFKHELKDLMRDEVKLHMKEVTKEIALSLYEDIGKDVIKTMVAQELQGLVRSYDVDDDDD
jgi:hypothetical protein